MITTARLLLTALLLAVLATPAAAVPKTNPKSRAGDVGVLDF